MMTKMKQNWMYKDVNEHFNFEKSLVLFIFLIFFYKRSAKHVIRYLKRRLGNIYIEKYSPPM